MSAAAGTLAPAALPLGVVLAHLAMGQVRLRAALRRHRAAPGGEGEKARAAARSLRAVPVAAVPAFVLCVHAVLGGGRDPGTAGAAALALSVVLLMVSAFLPFYQLRMRTTPGVRPRDVAAAMARGAAFQAVVYAVAIGGASLSVALAALASPGLPPAARALVAGAGVAAGMALVFAGFPFLVRALHRGERLDDPALREGLARLEAVSGMRLGPIYRVRSPEGSANAMVSGIVPGARWIFVTDAFLRGARPDEVVAIVAHELAHLKHRHLPRNLLRGLPGAVGGGLFMLGVWKALAWMGTDPGPVAVVVAAMTGWLLLSLLSSLPASRAHEHEADRTAAGWVGAETYARALTRLYALNRAPEELGPVERVLSTHPSLRKRLDSL